MTEQEAQTVTVDDESLADILGVGEDEKAALRTPCTRETQAAAGPGSAPPHRVLLGSESARNGACTKLAGGGSGLNIDVGLMPR